MNNKQKRILIFVGLLAFLSFTVYYGIKTARKYFWNMHLSSFMPVTPSVYTESDPVEDIKRASGLIKENPKDAWAYYLRGSAYAFMCKQEEADDDYRKAAEYGAENIVLLNAISHRYYYLLVMPERSLQVSDVAIRLDQDSVDANINEGRALLYMGHYDNALAALDRAIDLSFRCAEAYRLKMMALGELRRYEDALPLTEKLITFDPYDLDSYNAKAYFLVAANKPGEALEVIDNVLAYKNIHGSSRITICYRAFALLRRSGEGDKAEAADILNKVVEGCQEDEAAMYAYGMLGNKEEFIKRLPKRNPDSRIWVRSNMMFEVFWDDPDFLDAMAI